MSVASLLKNFSTNVSIYAQDPGRALVHLGALGWLLSASAQLFMISTNKDINKEQKKFLVPQEIADGVLNVGLYYTITAGIKKIADNIVEKRAKDSGLLEQLKKADVDFKGFKNGVGVVAAVGASVLASSIITPIVRNKVANQFQKKAMEEGHPIPAQYYSYSRLNQNPLPTVFGKFKV